MMNPDPVGVPVNALNVILVPTVGVLTKDVGFLKKRKSNFLSSLAITI